MTQPKKLAVAIFFVDVEVFVVCVFDLSVAFDVVLLILYLFFLFILLFLVILLLVLLVPQTSL